jgi:hypothetical protein
MKIALCFIISYEHILNKETIWREWIEPNKDIINVYFFYSDYSKIKSSWIKEHAIPRECIKKTSYYYVIPAYVSILNYAFTHDKTNMWFSLLTDSCCPLISPKRFRYLFYKNYYKSIFSWKRAWWNPSFHCRGNLLKLPKELWLANEPWFILTRENVKQVFHFIQTQQKVTKTICDGGLANETLFAVIFYYYGELKKNRIITKSTHIIDWIRPGSSPTSPYLFKEGNEKDIAFIENELKNDFAIYIRKISPEFPDTILRNYIYQYRSTEDNKLSLITPLPILFNYIKKYCIIGVLLFLFILYVNGFTIAVF